MLWTDTLCSFFHVFGLMMASLSTKYYQFILSQSVCSSIGASLLFYPATSCLATWFMKKRAVAFSIEDGDLGYDTCGSVLAACGLPAWAIVQQCRQETDQPTVVKPMHRSYPDTLARVTNNPPQCRYSINLIVRQDLFL